MAIILIRTVIIYIVLVGAMRIMGKRQLGQLEVSDLASTLLLSEIAALPIENHSIPLVYAIIPIVLVLAAATQLIFNIWSNCFIKLFMYL